MSYLRKPIKVYIAVLEYDLGLVLKLAKSEKADITYYQNTNLINLVCSYNNMSTRLLVEAFIVMCWGLTGYIMMWNFWLSIYIYIAVRDEGLVALFFWLVHIQEHKHNAPSNIIFSACPNMFLK